MVIEHPYLLLGILLLGVILEFLWASRERKLDPECASDKTAEEAQAIWDELRSYAVSVPEDES
jgi:hypothetical protein